MRVSDMHPFMREVLASANVDVLSSVSTFTAADSVISAFDARCIVSIDLFIIEISKRFRCRQCNHIPHS